MGSLEVPTRPKRSLRTQYSFCPDAPHDAVVRRLEELSNAAETAGFSELRGCLTWLMNALSPES